MTDKPFAITLDVGSSLANKTGTWRTERAEYVDRLPPCSNACPAPRRAERCCPQTKSTDPAEPRSFQNFCMSAENNSCRTLLFPACPSGEAFSI